jgi:hypothetical protein
MYTFFDENNTSDSACVVVDFISGYAGISGSLLQQVRFSNPYPNPANGSVSFNYTLPESIREAKLQIHNLIGSVVKEIRITEDQGRLNVTTSDMREGIYFYTLLVEDKSITAGKLIIKR